MFIFAWTNAPPAFPQYITTQLYIFHLTISSITLIIFGQFTIKRLSLHPPNYVLLPSRTNIMHFRTILCVRWVHSWQSTLCFSEQFVLCLKSTISRIGNRGWNTHTHTIFSEGIAENARNSDGLAGKFTVNVSAQQSKTEREMESFVRWETGLSIMLCLSI